MNKTQTISRYYTGNSQLQIRKPTSTDLYVMRQMQEEGFNTWQTSSKLHMMVRAAMASGKTNLVKFIMAGWLHNPRKRALAVVPACNIGDGYAEKCILSYPDDWDLPDTNWDIHTKEHFTDSQTNVFKNFVNWLKVDNVLLPENTRRGVVSHVTFSRLIEEGYGYLLKDIIINIDEIHHSAHDGKDGNVLGKAINYTLNKANKQGINLILTTATPSRTDAFKLIGDKHKDEFVEYEYNFAQYLDSTNYVKGYDYKILPDKKNWIGITKDNNLIKRGDKVIVFMPGEGHKQVTKKVKEDNIKDWIKAVSDKYTRVAFDSNGICEVNIKGRKYRILNLVE